MASEIVKHKFVLKEEDFGFERELDEKKARVTYTHKTSNKPYLAAAKEAGFDKVDIQNFENFNNEYSRKFINDVAEPLISKELASDDVNSVEVSSPIGIRGTFRVSGRKGKLADNFKGFGDKEVEDKNFVSVEIKNRAMLGITKSEVNDISSDIKAKVFKNK